MGSPRSPVVDDEGDHLEELLRLHARPVQDVALPGDALGATSRPNFRTTDELHRARAADVLRCRVCSKPLDYFHADQGTHPTCEPDPQPLPEPPSTLATLHDALAAYDAARPRTQQAAIGPSEVCVPCDRQLGYALHNTPRQPEPLMWAAMQGTAADRYVTSVLQWVNEQMGRERWLTQRPVEVDPGLTGTGDAYDCDEATVVDWKLVGKTTLEKVRGNTRRPTQAKPAHAGQVQLYGRGWQRAGYDVRFVRVVYLARSHDFWESVEWTARYSRKEADAYLDRMYKVMNLLTDVNVAAHPQLWAAIPASPGPDCRSSCPYYRTKLPADGTGCPGDVEADQRREERWNDGLIPPKK